MGWTYCQKDTGQSVEDFLRHEFNSDKHEVVDIEIVNNVSYLAMKYIKENEVYAVVCLLSEGDHKTGVGYKDMDEQMQPFSYDCPLRILELLSPTISEYAKKWREECWKKHTNSKRFIKEIE